MKFKNVLDWLHAKDEGGKISWVIYRHGLVLIGILTIVWYVLMVACILEKIGKSGN